MSLTTVKINGITLPKFKFVKSAASVITGERLTQTEFIEELLKTYIQYHNIQYPLKSKETIEEGTD